MKNLDLHMIRFQNKVAAGADFIQTQPVFDTEAFQRWITKVEEAGLTDRVPILAGVAASEVAKVGRISEGSGFGY